MSKTLPPFPVDDATLDMLSAALDPRSAGDSAATGSCVEYFLDLMSQLGGSDIHAVESAEDGIYVMRDPRYHVNNVLEALVVEIRRLRTAQ